MPGCIVHKRRVAAVGQSHPGWLWHLFGLHGFPDCQLYAFFLIFSFFHASFVYLVYVHLFIIVLDLIKADKRKFPATTHLYEFVATSMFSISFLLGGSNPEKNVWCSDEGTYATQNNNTTCAVQGMRFKKNKRKK